MFTLHKEIRVVTLTQFAQINRHNASLMARLLDLNRATIASYLRSEREYLIQDNLDGTYTFINHPCGSKK